MPRRDVTNSAKYATSVGNLGSRCAGAHESDAPPRGQCPWPVVTRLGQEVGERAQLAEAQPADLVAHLVDNVAQQGGKRRAVSEAALRPAKQPFGAAHDNRDQEPAESARRHGREMFDCKVAPLRQVRGGTGPDATGDLVSPRPRN
jgi:membrane-bound lytic murein transglycosylase B